MTTFGIPIRPGLELKLYQASMAPTLFATVDANRAHLREWLPWVDASTEAKHSLEFITRSLASFAEGKGIGLGIWESGQLIGGVGTRDIDALNQSTEIGYWLTMDAVGRGIMTAACRALIDYLFTERELNRVWLIAATGNTRSNAVAERLGMTREGTLRQDIQLHGVFHDCYLWSLLRGEWNGA